MYFDRMLCWASAFVALVFFADLSPSHGAIVVSSANRVVMADSSLTSADTSFGSNSQELDSLAGVFDEQAYSESSNNAPEFVSAAAKQVSNIQALILSGSGDALGNVTLTVDETKASSTAQSLYSVLFTVDADGPYAFNASAKWQGNTEVYSGRSLVQLIAPDDNLIINAYVDSDAPSFSSIFGEVPLITGVEYRLLASAEVTGDSDDIGTFEAIGTWSFNLAPAESPAETGVVPEPTSMAIWTLSALSCAIAGYRRRNVASCDAV